MIRIVLVLASALISFAGSASAGPKEDVAAATATDALAQNDPDKVLTL
jgi:hypothetical protein